MHMLSKNLMDRMEQLYDPAQFEILTLNEEMTLSQVVKFFAKKNIHFTNTMIQNYVRVGVLPPPKDKRYYTRNHLTMLMLIHPLKSIYSLDEIKEVFAPVLKQPDTFEDDMIDVSHVLDSYVNMYKSGVKHWQSLLPKALKAAERLVDENQVPEEDQNQALLFMIRLMVMAFSVSAHQLLLHSIKMND